jgi:hypothetical protein
MPSDLLSLRTRIRVINRHSFFDGASFHQGQYFDCFHGGATLPQPSLGHGVPGGPWFCLYLTPSFRGGNRQDIIHFHSILSGTTF